MLKTDIFALLFVTMLMLTACQTAAPTGADTSALEARIAALEEKVNGVAGAASAGDVAALTNRVTVIEEQAVMASGGGMTMDHGEATETMEPSMEAGDHSAAGVTMNADPLFAVTMATYLMDTAGFHGMDETINGEGTIPATYAATVNRVRRVLSVTPWSPELAEQATAFQATLAEFAAVLESDDVEAAKPLATRVHEEQHDFSHAIEAWANAQMGMQGEDEHSH